MFQFGSIFSWPHSIYWIISICPIFAIVGSFSYDFYIKGSFDMKVPLPSSLLSGEIPQQIFGWAMVPTVACMLLVGFQIFSFLGRQKVKSTVITLMKFSIVILQIVSSISLIGMSFFTVRDLNPHLISHSIFLITQVGLFFLISYSLKKVNRSYPSFINLFDVILFILNLFYLIAGYIKIFNNKGIPLYIIGITGFIILFFTFIRYPILGYQLKSKSFFLTQKPKRK